MIPVSHLWIRISAAKGYRMGSVATNDARLVELMKAAQTGDREAYEQLLETVTPLLRRAVRRQREFLGSDEVEDLVQEILLSLHAVRTTYDPERPFTPWLLAIMRNRLADGARRHARTSAHEVARDDLDVTFSSRDANLLYEGYGDPEALHQAIEALPAGQRQAIELLKLREMSLKEAAAVSGTTVGALKVATHRAMVALRRLLTSK
jgi:RNA polymerase sigma-70 factor (ECF subfamily)